MICNAIADRDGAIQRVAQFDASARHGLMPVLAMVSQRAVGYGQAAWRTRVDDVIV